MGHALQRDELVGGVTGSRGSGLYFGTDRAPFSIILNEDGSAATVKPLFVVR